VNKDVLAASGTEPVPVAGAPVVEGELELAGEEGVLEPPDEEDALELLVDELVPSYSHLPNRH
jgi:hypothetical protein